MAPRASLPLLLGPAERTGSLTAPQCCHSIQQRQSHCSLGTVRRAEGWAQGRKEWVDCKYAQVCMTLLPPLNGSYWGNCFNCPSSVLPKAEGETKALSPKPPPVAGEDYRTLGLVVAEHYQQGLTWPGTQISGI